MPSWSRKQAKVQSGSPRAGLTLIELVVVLAILAGLASILVPLMPNLLRRAHKATDATQTSELNKAVQLYQAAYYSYPDNYDLLVKTAGGFPAYVPGATSTAGAFGGYVKSVALSTLDSGPVSALDALNNVGINVGQPLADDDTAPNFHPTRHPYPDDTSAGISGTTLAASTFVAQLDTTKIDNGLLTNIINADPTATFMVVGVGPRCSMVGNIVQDAPLSVSQKKDFTPDNTYSRVGLVYLVGGKEVGRTERARLVACVALEDDELEPTEKDIVGYYEVSRDPRN
ncbi:MAG TPA: type II secretion system protein [Pirellulales bacterium]|jgi:prepilin-type N-terminal cleavage/methylation domain-containing protein|nr:type II secretion system protein [Pirellulales bacterium]